MVYSTSRINKHKRHYNISDRRTGALDGAIPIGCSGGRARCKSQLCIPSIRRDVQTKHYPTNPSAQNHAVDHDASQNNIKQLHILPNSSLGARILPLRSCPPSTVF